MTRSPKLFIPIVPLLSLALTLLATPKAGQAHCDALDGPVIQAAQLALEKQNVEPVLKWIHADGEADIRDAFQRTLAVRQAGDAARELADTYFFETLVRIHRAGEGEPYTGLKPAGQVEAIIVAADRALDAGTVEPLAHDLALDIQNQVAARFQRVSSAKSHAEESVEAGREFVAAYVDYVHFVENLHRLLASPVKHGACGH